MQGLDGQVARMLHEEHVAVLGLLQRLTAVLNRHGPAAPPDSDDPAMGQLLGALAAAIETEIATHFAFEESDLFRLLDANGVPAGPVMNHAELFSDPQALARDMVVEVTHPSAGATRTLGVPIKLSDTPGAIRRPAPRHGEHTVEVLGKQVKGAAAE